MGVTDPWRNLLETSLMLILRLNSNRNYDVIGRAYSLPGESGTISGRYPEVPGQYSSFIIEGKTRDFVMLFLHETLNPFGDSFDEYALSRQLLTNPFKSPVEVLPGNTYQIPSEGVTVPGSMRSPMD